MDLETLHSEWQKDCRIDILKLQEESAKTFTLHSKYSRLLSKEKITLSALEQTLKKHKFDLTNDLEGNDVLPDFKQIAKDYRAEKERFKKLSKGEIESLVENNDDTRKLHLKINLSKEKIRFLESILRFLLDRTFAIKNIIDHNKYQNGM